MAFTVGSCGWFVGSFKKLPTLVMSCFYYVFCGLWVVVGGYARARMHFLFTENKNSRLYRKTTHNYPHYPQLTYLINKSISYKCGWFVGSFKNYPQLAI